MVDSAYADLGGADLPKPLVTNLPNGINELTKNKIPCILPSDDLNTTVMPYVIRYHNQSQVKSAIEEAVMMDRSYSPKIENRLDVSGRGIREFISRIKSPGSDYSGFNYLPMAD